MRHADFPELKILLAEIKSTLDVCSRSLSEAHQLARRSSDAPATHVDDVFAEVRRREHALRTSIAAAQSASPETAPALRAEVANNYDAYARAVMTAETLTRHLRSTSFANRQ